MKENNSINERVLYIIDNEYNSNRTKFADSIGFAPQVINNIVSGRRSKPSFDVLNAIITTNDAIDSEWLLTGKGSMLKTDAPASAVKGIPLIPLDAMAGFGSGSMQIMEWDTESYVIPEFEELDVDFLIRVKGSSMQPKYNSGDLVACRKLDTNNIFWQWNKVYVLDTDQGPLIKRVKKAKTKDSLLIVSENKNYDEFELHLSHVYAIALVVGVVRFE